MNTTKSHVGLLEHNEKRQNVLICVCGSVAAVKVPEIAVEINMFANVKIACSSNGLFFLKRAENYDFKSWQSFLKIGGLDLIITDDYEWSSWQKVGDPVNHIELRRWADLLIVCPASANSLAKVATGIADNLVLSVIRAWDYSKPCLICPAMNTLMYDHPVTKKTLHVLEVWGWHIVYPIVKELACKDTGKGALAGVPTIIAYIKKYLHPSIISRYINYERIYGYCTGFLHKCIYRYVPSFLFGLCSGYLLHYPFQRFFT
jgi:phosphopantothenoylcysteine decarboxylase